MFSVEIFILLCVYFSRAYSQQWSQQSLANLQQQMNGFTFPFNPNLQYPPNPPYSPSQQQLSSIMWPSSSSYSSQYPQQISPISTPSFPYSSYSNFPTQYPSRFPVMQAPSTPNNLYQTDMKIQKPPKDEVPQKGPTRVIPPFLQDASDKEKDEFYAIVQNPEWSPAEKGQKIETLMSTMSSDKQKLYYQFQAETGSELDRKRLNVHRAVEGMSDKAKAIFQRQFINTVTDTSLNRQEKDEQVEQLMETQPDNVKTAFEQYRQQVAEHAKEFADMVGDKIDAMPPQARRAANKLHFIETNPNLSQQERNDRAKAFFEALPANVQDEIKQMRGSLPPVG
ncbi:hypothetical protein WR25_25357 [Diploscapter pachys]|uniref:SXP/RAL-2 family protein Ani s 5-like cation-binding domain-containing protein n=1 Tax=Diploscapter pachys TaxID=2018661 RepID=A0A2A2JRI9_9BILA|nr:hypothetical protein WR25_25357 [Diploscapter pachys]